MTFNSKLDCFDSDLWGHHFHVPQEIAESFVQSTGRRVVCTINRKISYHCALMQWSGGQYFININKKHRTTLGIQVGQEVEIALIPDDSSYGLPISEEFEEVLRQDDEASDIFHQLTPGKQRTLIYYADNVKSSQIKLRRGLVVAEHLKNNQGVVDFKALNEEMKAANRRERLR